MEEQHSSNKSVSVGTSAVEVLPDLTNGQDVTGKRKAFVITNTSTGGQKISLSIGQNAVANTGIILYPGGTWAEAVDPAFEPTNRNISGIASAASGSVSVMERINPNPQ